MFTTSRKQSQLTAIDLFSYSQSNPLLSAPIESDDVAKFSDPILSQTASRGIAFLHSGLTKADTDLVKLLYRKGILLVVVMPYTMSWEAPGTALITT